MTQHIYEKHVFVCLNDKACLPEGAQPVFDELRKLANAHGLKGKVRINKSGCLDQCGNGPMVVVYPEAVWYAKVTLADCQEIVASHLVGNKPVERLLYDGRGKVTS